MQDIHAYRIAMTWQFTMCFFMMKHQIVICDSAVHLALLVEHKRFYTLYFPEKITNQFQTKQINKVDSNKQVDKFLANTAAELEEVFTGGKVVTLPLLVVVGPSVVITVVELSVAVDGVLRVGPGGVVVQLPSSQPHNKKSVASILSTSAISFLNLAISETVNEEN